MTTQQNIDSTILAFDYGEKRLGVAVSTAGDAHVQTLPIIDASDAEQMWRSIDELIKQYKPALSVVGRPRTMEGELSAQSERAAQFANELEQTRSIKVIMQDETLSSDEAIKRLPKNTPIQKQRKLLDSIAAQIILEDYLS